LARVRALAEMAEEQQVWPEAASQAFLVVAEQLAPPVGFAAR
jgi:hypothetical protein